MSTGISEPPSRPSCFRTCFLTEHSPHRARVILLKQNFSDHFSAQTLPWLPYPALSSTVLPSLSKQQLHPPSCCSLNKQNQAFFCLTAFLFAISSVWNIPSPNIHIVGPFSLFRAFAQISLKPPPASISKGLSSLFLRTSVHRFELILILGSWSTVLSDPCITFFFYL